MKRGERVIWLPSAFLLHDVLAVAQHVEVLRDGGWGHSCSGSTLGSGQGMVGLVEELFELCSLLC